MHPTNRSFDRVRTCFCADRKAPTYTVAVPNFNVDLLGHSYFAQVEALLHDIYDLIRHNDAPEKRQRLEPTEFEGAAFWKLRR
jgi:hypothetical protein